ncbi:hypothetical protein STEG23_027242, partial [Scotinomys teguina]
LQSLTPLQKKLPCPLQSAGTQIMDFWLQLGPLTSSWLQVAAQTMDIPMVFGSNMATDTNTVPEINVLCK